ncbi:MAG: hypothetical protein IJU79_01595 [Desulfovibrionaceae bacterium]|nr:hypothetical protein [Desulfovibrionaceae bacterium]
MLEAVATSTYKDLFQIVGKLDEWMEQAGTGALPSQPPPKDLVDQFQVLMERTQNVGAIDAPETKVRAMSQAEIINLDKGMAAVDSVKPKSEALELMQNLGEILQKEANQLSPADLLQVQRLAGLIKVQAETGKKVSEGVSDTLEQLLEQQG